MSRNLAALPTLCLRLAFTYGPRRINDPQPAEGQSGGLVHRVRTAAPPSWPAQGDARATTAGPRYVQLASELGTGDAGAVEVALATAGEVGVDGARVRALRVHLGRSN